MEVHSHPVIIVLDEADVSDAAWQLVKAVRALTPRNGAPPRLLLDISDQVNRIDQARQAAAGRARGNLAAPSAPGAGTLTVAEASERARVSDSFIRRCCRERIHFAAERDDWRGTWLINAASFASWLAARRRARERAEAA